MAPSEIDLRGARLFLGQRYSQRVENVELVGEGAWSRCYGYVVDGQELVVRFGRQFDDFAKDQRASRFAGPCLPVPRCVDVGPLAGTGGREHFAISQRCRGEFLEHLDEAGWRAVLPSLFACIDAMHDADLSTTTGFGDWGSDGNAPSAGWPEFLLDIAVDSPARRTHGWRAVLDTSPAGAAMFDAALVRLRGVLADLQPIRRCLIHGDLINRNVVVAGSNVAGVFDWGCSMYGDQLYDIAWIWFWSPWYPALEPMDIVGRFREHLARTGRSVPQLDERLHAIALHIGLAHLAYNAFLADWPVQGRLMTRLAPFVQ